MKIMILSLLILSNIVYADYKTDLKDAYVKDITILHFFSSTDAISSGHYTFDTLDASLKSTFFPFTYQFDNHDNYYNYYVNGSIGFSTFEQNALNTEKLRTYALKLGGGTRLKTSTNTDIMFGASYMCSRINAETSNVQHINNIFDTTQNHHSYELATSFEYHPMINGYHPYVRVGTRYIETSVDDTYLDIPHIKSTISKLSIGIITPPITTIYAEPVNLEFYASAILLAGDIKDAIEVNKVYVLGAKFYLGAYPLTRWVEDAVSWERDSISWIKNITLNINLIKSNSFDGINFGLGLAF